jgi:threonine dehydrogenase-like Zn-dependent dehydrogenase
MTCSANLTQSQQTPPADHEIDESRVYGNAAETDVVDAVAKPTGGFGADVVIDAAGRPETWKQASYARDLAGTVVLVGVPTPDTRAADAAAGLLLPRRRTEVLLVWRLPARA